MNLLVNDKSIITYSYGRKMDHSKSSKVKMDGCDLLWLHPPKTASTFCFSVQHACNETLFLKQASLSTGYKYFRGCTILEPNGTFYSNRHHYGLSLYHLDDMYILKNYITMLRNPESRLISAFCDHMHDEGMTDKSKGKLIKHMGFGKQAPAFINGSICIEQFNRFASFGPHHGCYVKMLNGFQCAEERIITKAMVDIAVFHLFKFLFVGIMEEYKSSVELFLYLAANYTDPQSFAVNEDFISKHRETGIPIKKEELVHKLQPPLPVELQRTRAGTHACLPYLKEASALHQLQFHDPYDSVVYAYAVKKFHKQVKRMISTL